VAILSPVDCYSK